MNRKEVPHRVTLCENGDIDYNHILSDGFGIPAVVISCPIESEFEKYTGNDEYADKVEGISFDDCMDCEFFGGLGSGQEIDCIYERL